MELIDENGNLFGAVNVVDALVIVLAVTVVVAGAAVLGQSDDRSETTRYVTVELEDQPEYVAERISEGDRMRRNGHNLTISDVYVSPASDGLVSVVIRSAVEGFEADEASAIHYGDGLLQSGTPLEVETTEYSVSGTVVAIDERGRELDVSETTVTLSGTTTAGTARNIEVGDEYSIGGQSVAKVEFLHFGPGSSPDQRTVVMGVTLQTISRSGTDRFAGSTLGLNRPVSLDFGTYNVTGTIDEVGATEPNVHEEVVTLRTTVDTSVAERLETGDVYRIAGRTVATLESVSVYPTTDADRKRVLLETRLRTFGGEESNRFGSVPVKRGASIPFETVSYSISGTIVGRSSFSQDDDVRITATVKLRNVPPEVANGVSVGMTEESRGTMIARVTDKRVEPAVVILTSNDGNIYEREHPRNKDVYLTVELAGRDTKEGVRFHGERLQQGNDVILDFETITVSGTVLDLEAG